MYQMSIEEFEKILAFVNDENSDVLSTDIPSRFINIVSAFNSKLFRGYCGEKRKHGAAERTIARLRTRLEGRTAEGQFIELDLDSLEVALCIVYLLNRMNLPYTRERVQYLLYEAYSRWLSDNEERMTSEHPVAQEWGPHFWHISKKCGKTAPVTSVEDYNAIAAKNPGIAKFLYNVVRKYADWSDNELKRNFVQSVPYRNAMAKPDSTTPDGRKWGREIKDSDIFAWKK